MTAITWTGDNILNLRCVIDKTKEHTLLQYVENDVILLKCDSGDKPFDYRVKIGDKLVLNDGNLEHIPAQ